MKPSLCSVTTSGLIHIWSTTTTEKWGAFAAGFEELDENLDYEEREDEFDIVSLPPSRLTLNEAEGSDYRKMKRQY